MDFYIARSTDEIRRKDYCVGIEDELLDYLYSLKEQVPYKKLYDIDPYEVVVVGKDVIIDIIKLCKYIKELELLDDYGDIDEANAALDNLIEMGEKAIMEKKELLSVGD